MRTKKNTGVSTVIGTVLLIALSVVLISVVSISVISGVDAFETLEHKVVGFTVEVNDTYDNAVIAPVSGKDLPYLQSYTVYTDTGATFSSDCNSCKVYHFDTNVTYVNIVGNFSDGITALVFSGRVTDGSNIVGKHGWNQY
jgi:FlaG/FlaF family flagellin (archaellin)